MKAMIYSSSGFKETFTRAHLEHISPKFALSGNPYPDSLNGRSILPGSWKQRLLRYSNVKQKGIAPVHYEIGIRNALRTNSPDVIFCEFGDAAATLFPYCKELGIPFGAGFYGFDAFQTSTVAKYLPIYKEMFSYASFIMTQSESIKRELIDLGCPPEKAVVNTCPPVDDFKDVQPDLDSKHLLFVGRFVEKKSPQTLVLVMKELIQRDSEIRLTFAGDGPLLDSTRQLSRLLNLDSHISFAGRVNREEQIRLFRGSAIMVQHSVEAFSGDKEGIPVVLLEAGMSGLPVVSTRHSGISEIIIDGKTGLLVDEFDVKGMAESILSLLSDDSRRKEMGEEARKYIRGKYAMEQHIEVLRELMKSAANGAT